MIYLLLTLMLLCTFFSKNFNILKFFIFSILLILAFFWYSCNEYTGNGITESVIYTMTSDISGFSLYDVRKYIIIFIILLLITLISITISFKLKRKNGYFDALFFVLLISCIFTPQAKDYFNAYLNLYEKDKMLLKTNSLIHKEYKVPTINKSSLNKNFVFIFAESLERSYRDVNGINFLPNISKLENQLDFNNIKQTSGSGWTIADNVNVLCGLPLFGVINQASLTETFLPKATCMTDQLNNIGYEQIYISGSSTIFAGTKNLLSNHKVNNIYDIEDFKKIISKKDIIAWGVTDDIVLEKAFDTFIEKSKNREKFAIYVSTVDTHFPDGVFLDVCKNKIDTTNISEEIQKSILCSDYLISELIKRIQKSDYYKDTTIVLISDHFMMGEQPYFKYSDRRNTFSIFSHDIKNTIINNEGSLIDVSPTVLSFITDEDIDFGFGVNLLNNNKKNPLLKSKDNDEYVSFVKDLWSLPNINDKIINHSSDYIRISGQKFKIPLSGYVDDNGKIIDFSATPHIVEKYKKDCLSKNNNHVFMINKINDDLILLLKSNNDELKEFKFDKNGNTLEIKKLKINENIDYVNNFM